MVKRTLDDIYMLYFSSQVMLMLRRRLRGHFVTVIQIVQSLSVVGVLCFCSPLRCICESGGVNFLILSTGLKQQAAVRIQSGKTWYKSTKPLFVGRVRSKICISSEMSRCYSSPLSPSLQNNFESQVALFCSMKINTVLGGVGGWVSLIRSYVVLIKLSGMEQNP